MLAVTPFSPAIWALAICWGFAQLFLNSSYGAVTAMLPDQVCVRGCHDSGFFCRLGVTPKLRGYKGSLSRG